MRPYNGTKIARIVITSQIKIKIHRKITEMETETELNSGIETAI